MRRRVKGAGVRRPPVVLYQPRDEGAWMPLGLLAVGSGLSEENVVIVDGRFEIAPEARIVELAEHAACLAVTVRTGPPLRDALRVSAAARAVNPKLTILWGGAHATLAPGSCLGAGPVDACARGSGEATLGEVLRAARAGRGLAGIPGLAVRGEPLPSPLLAPAPEALPRVNYSLLDLERHFEARGARRLDYCASRGSREAGWTPLPLERVTAELGELADRHHLVEVVFQDEDFFADAAWAEALVEGMAAAMPRLGWRARARVDDILDGGHDRLRLLAASGCRGVLVSLPKDLPPVGEARERTLDAARLLHAAGLAARFDLVLAQAGPRLEHLQAMLSLARALSALDGRFETPLRRAPDLVSVLPADAGLEAWIARADAPWADPRAEKRLARASFYIREAQRPPGRRLGKQLLRTLSLLRVRLGFFAFGVERRAVEASAVLRTGRPRQLRRHD